MKARSLITAIGTAAVGSVVLAGAAIAQTNQYDDDLFLNRPGEFMVANGQTKEIAHSKTDQLYRICVGRGGLNVPLNVTHDGATAMVHPGDCSDFDAKSISVAAGGQLPEDAVMFGRYHHVTK